MTMHSKILTPLLGAFIVLLAGNSGMAQSERLKPKQPEKKPAKAAKPAAAEAAGLPGSPRDPGPALKGVVIVGDRASIKAKGDVAAAGVVVGSGKELDLLRLWDKELRAMIQPLLGQPINTYNLGRLQREIVLMYRRHHHPLVDVVLPEQESVSSGVVQVFVLEGRLGKVQVEGNKYYSTEVFTRAIRLQPGDLIDADKLLTDVDWLNRNPGRYTDVAFRQGQKLGESDVVLNVKDRFPVRGYVGYENNGPRFVGEDRLFAGANWFNVFGWDHRLSYQYTTDVELKLLHAHSLSYEIPLPWRHTLSLYGGYADSEADLNTALVSQRGSSLQVSGRYEIPLGRVGNFSHSVNFGLDFKRLDNTLEFGGAPVFGGNLDIFQVAGQYRTTCLDKWGASGVSLEGFWSPGGITSNNSDAAFRAYRGPQSDSSYGYGRLSLERETKLPAGFSWVLRATGQMATGNIPTSEQLGLGGSLGPRGYDEREANGDQGYLLMNEIVTPGFPLLERFNSRAKDNIKLLAFFDFGQTQNIDLILGEDPHLEMMSAGVGLRYQFRTNLGARFDYGWQLKDTGPVNPHSPRNSRGTVSVILSF